MTPYFVNVKVENMGRTSLSYASLKLDGVLEGGAGTGVIAASAAVAAVPGPGVRHPGRGVVAQSGLYDDSRGAAPLLRPDPRLARR
ncbi:hypothetical protein ABZ252_10865 [Streptomyces sp. NPDC006175]|uniref:hypothetical protein n=1 Tax=Streptomyces sp. NPDC006175 TaxID=3154471 RepID=UPI0033B0FE76